MAYRLSWIMTTFNQFDQLETNAWACDYPDITSVLADMKKQQNIHNDNVRSGEVKGHPAFIHFHPIEQVENRFVDKGVKGARKEYIPDGQRGPRNVRDNGSYDWDVPLK